MNCSTGVALDKGIKCCQSEVDVKAFSAKKKCRIFSFWGHNALIAMSDLLARSEKMKGSSWQIYD